MPRGGERHLPKGASTSPPLTFRYRDNKTGQTKRCTLTAGISTPGGPDAPSTHPQITTHRSKTQVGRTAMATRRIEFNEAFVAALRDKKP